MMRRWNRKLWAAILTVTMATSLTACGGKNSGTGGGTDSLPATGTQNETAILQQGTDSNTEGSTVPLAQDGRPLQIPDDNYCTYYELFV